MEIISVVDYIRDDDIFYISRRKEVDNHVPGEIIREYRDASCTGADLKEYVLSFQSNFLFDITDRVNTLTFTFNRIQNDFREIQELHEEHYQEHITGKVNLKARIETNESEDQAQRSELLNIQKQEWRVTRLHHLLENKDLSDKEIPVGGVKVIMEEGSNGNYQDVKEFRFHTTDNSLTSRNFWGHRS